MARFRASRQHARLWFVTALVVALLAGQGVVPAGATWQTYLEPQVISRAAAGGPANDYSDNADISGDGRYIVFDSYASNLLADEYPENRRGVFRHDRIEGVTELVSAPVDEIGDTGRGSRDPKISDDGRYVLFFTGNQYVEEDTNGGQDFYIRDMSTGEYKWIDFFGDGEAIGNIIPEEDNRTEIDFAGDGSYLVFCAYEGDLLGTGRTDTWRNVWGYDVESDEATLVSVPEDGYGSRGSRTPAISDDGRYVAFLTGNSWDPNDENDEQDIYVRDMETGDLRWIDFAGDGSPVLDGVHGITISGDGSRIAFTSEWTSLLPDDTEADSDVYTYDLVSEEATLVSGPHVGGRGSRSPELSDDGRYVVFYTGQDFAPEDVNEGRDLYMKDMETGELSRLPLMGDGPLESDGFRPRIAANVAGGVEAAKIAEGGPIRQFAISADASSIVFESYDLVDRDTNESQDIYHWDMDRSKLVEGAERVSGRDRYATAAEFSRQSFPDGASTAVIASGENWPDALCGAGLAGAVDGPMLLTRGGSLTPVAKAELVRLKARNVYLLGGYDAIDPEVEAQLEAMLPGFVWRIGGPDRFATSRAVANRIVETLGSRYDGKVCVTTGLNFPDAVGAAPLSAGIGWPVVLVRPAGTSVNLPPSASSAVILGKGIAVGPGIEKYLVAELGADNVDRRGGADRYETAAAVAQYGVDNGLHWDGVGLSTGTNFPDALAGGAMLGLHRSPLLLTHYGSLHPAAGMKLQANKAEIESVGFLGGEAALSANVVSRVKALLGF